MLPMDSMYLGIRAHATEVTLKAAKIAELADKREPDSEIRQVIAEIHRHLGEIAASLAEADRIRASWDRESQE